MPFFLTPSYADCILRSALRGRVSCCLRAGSTTWNKALVTTEGDLGTRVLNLHMIKLSPREEAGFAGVTPGVRQDYSLCLLNLRL